jgi:hypothetical protein
VNHPVQHTVHLDHIGLSQRPGFNTFQVGPPGSFGNRKGIIAIILVTFDKGLDVLRRD